jgi:hypothetical protein
MQRFIILFSILMSAVAMNVPGACAQNFRLGSPLIVPPPLPELPIYQFMPDGHITYFKDGDNYQMYWAGEPSYRSCGADIFHQQNARAVLFKGEKGSYDNGGAWLYSVFHQIGAAQKSALISFYHAEDHEFAGDPDSHFIAWKSVALATSPDNGKTWAKQGQIISSARPKPDAPTWGGNGDFCVVRDEKNARWICFYQEHFLCMAVSSDKQARPGTWRKYYSGAFAQSGFTEPGLGGRNSPIPSLQNVPGGNPSVHWNTFLQRWVIVWQQWERGNLWMASSKNLTDWTQPKLLLAAQGDEKLWYPTVIGESDVVAGKNAMLCYARFKNAVLSEREFLVRPIEFSK